MICEIFNLPREDNISAQLGNMLLSGTRNAGYIAVYRRLICSLLSRSRTLVILQDEITAEEALGTNELIASFGKSVYDVSLSSAGNEIDILTAFTSPDEKANFIVSLLTGCGVTSEVSRNEAFSFYYYAASALDSIGERYTLNDLIRLNVDGVIDAVSRSDMDGEDKEDRLAFLGDAKTYSSFRSWWPCRDMLKSSGVCRALSGDQDCLDVFSEGRVTVVTGYSSELKRNRELLITAVMYALKACAERAVASSPLSVVLDRTDFMDCELAGDIMSYNAYLNCSVYTMLSDTYGYLNKNGIDLIGKIGSILLFQHDGGAADFWSEFCGAHEVNEAGFSLPMNGRRGASGGVLYGTGVLPKQKRKGAFMDIRRVSKPLFEARIFRELRQNEVIYYLKRPFRRGRSVIRGVSSCT